MKLNHSLPTRRMKPSLRLFLLTLSTITFLACIFGPSPDYAQARGGNTSQSTPDALLPQASRTMAPGFSLTDADGKPINLSDYRSKVVLLDFWATWCGGCKLEIPWYVEFDSKYRKQGLAVIGVSMDEDGWKAVKPFLARKIDPETGGNTAMKYPVVIGNDQLAKAYNLTSMPMTLLIDRQGKTALAHTGVVNKDDFEAHILQLLNQPALSD
jgi:peroxiredoxin